MNAPTRLTSMMQSARPVSAPQGGRNWELQPDAPITPPRRRARWRHAIRLGAVLVFCMGAYWGSAYDIQDWRRWAAAGLASLTTRAEVARTDAASGRVERTSPRPSDARLPEDTSHDQPESGAAATFPSPAAVVAPAAIRETPAKSPAPSEPTVGTAYTAPARAPDALERRAAAAGLHPDISRAVLQRLSAADFDNAATAISKAVAETPEDGMLVWPRQRRPELALFQIHFVEGAAPHCRRYVVTITKDNWMSTALPMERCGVKPVRARRS